MTTPQDPGNPEYTDPEATSPEAAEAAADAAQAAQDAQSEPAAGDADSDPSAGLDPSLDADLEEALADVAGEPADDAAADAGTDLAAQLNERTEDLQRLNAEYTNYRRRSERERLAAADNAKSKVLAQFLPILDDLELARQHGDLEDGALKAISDKLQSVLDGQGLVAFGAEGDAFDPEVHEAVQDLSTGGEQVLGTVLRRGYKVGEKLVRTAMVIIADPESESSGSGTDSQE